MKEWHKRAACHKDWVDQAWFFPQDVGEPREDGTYEQAYDEEGSLRARLICASCPMREKCWAENRDAEVGIFAGTDEHDRQKLWNATASRLKRWGNKVGIKPDKVTWDDIPVPIFRPHIARPAASLQIALYAFMRGSSISEAAALAEVPEKPVRSVIHDQQRHIA